MTKKPTDRVITLEKPKLASCRGETIPAEPAKRRLFTLSEAHAKHAAKAAKKPKLEDSELKVIEITPTGVVMGNAHKIHRETRKHKAEPEPIDKGEPEPIEVIEKPVAIHTDHKGKETVRSGPDYTVN